jgi:hypothetical protein
LSCGREIRDLLAIVFPNSGSRSGHFELSRKLGRVDAENHFSREIREVSGRGGKIMVLSLYHREVKLIVKLTIFLKTKILKHFLGNV